MSALTITQLVECAEPWVKYIAADSNGDVWFYESTPKILLTSGCFQPPTNSPRSDRFERLYGLEVTPWYTDWKDSVVSITQKPTEEHIGKLCAFWNLGGGYADAKLDILQRISFEDGYPYATISAWYRHCRLATKAEALSLVVE